MAILKGNTAENPTRHAIALDLGDLRTQGELVVAHAKKKAEQIVSEANAERQKLVSTASAEGYAAGLAKGTAEGLRQGREHGTTAAMAERKAALDGLDSAWLALANEIMAQREDMLAEARRNVVKLAIAVAERVVRRTVEADPTCVVQQVEAALAMVMRPSRVVLRINPADRGLVNAALPQLTDRLAEGVHLEMLDDATMGRGSCGLRMTDSMGGMIDATLANQLARIAEALVPAKPGEPTAPGQTAEAHGPTGGTSSAAPATGGAK
jgi:flagellar biosynthesis/type III secretory pathway protein FliH